MKITKQNLKKIIREEVLFSEGLKYHLREGLSLTESVYRPGSKAFFDLINEARARYFARELALTEDDAELVESDLGQWGVYEGREVALDFPISEEADVMLEAEYKGKKVELNKPKRGSPKAYVYVNSGKKDKKGRIKVKKVSFGSSLPDAMGDSPAHKKRRKSFGDRHNCADKKDKTKPGYWSCRATKFFGRNIAGWW